MKIKLKFSLLDGEYARALAAAICSYCEDFSITISEKGEEEGEFDLLVTDNQSFFKQEWEENRRCLILIKKQDEISHEIPKDVEQLASTESIEKIVSVLRKKYLKNTENEEFPFAGKWKSKVIAVTSHCGGSGVSCVANAISKEFAKETRKKILYFSLEVFESEEKGEETEIQREVSFDDFIYYLFTQKEKLTTPFMEVYLRRNILNGVYRFTPSYGVNAFHKLKEADANYFFHFLKECGYFNQIVIDLPGALLYQFQSVKEVVDYWVIVKSRVTKSKKREEALKIFLQDMGESNQPDIQEINFEGIAKDCVFETEDLFLETEDEQELEKEVEYIVKKFSA